MGSTGGEGPLLLLDVVLIPSSSGHGFNQAEMYRLDEIGGLNPFFIRAWVQPRPGRGPPRRRVLIPSSSGHGFNPRPGTRGARAPRVLIPSSSGHGFNPIAAARRGETARS